jgi:hypothetical protein
MRRTTAIVAIAALLSSIALGDPQQRKSRNYILRRQEAYQVQGTPTSRLIIGRRQIDVYPNGLMFEKDAVLGVRAKR